MINIDHPSFMGDFMGVIHGFSYVFLCFHSWKHHETTKPDSMDSVDHELGPGKVQPTSAGADFNRG